MLYVYEFMFYVYGNIETNKEHASRFPGVIIGSVVSK